MDQGQEVSQLEQGCDTVSAVIRVVQINVTETIVKTILEDLVLLVCVLLLA